MAKGTIKTVIAEVTGIGENLVTVEVPVSNRTEKAIVTELRTNGLRSYDKESNRSVWIAPANIKNILIEFA